MATLYVTEFSSLGPGPLGPPAIQAATGPPLAEQVVAISAIFAQQSSPFSSSTYIVRLHCDAICSVRIGGKNPTATTSSARMIAGQTEFFTVKPGDAVSVIGNT